MFKEVVHILTTLIESFEVQVCVSSTYKFILFLTVITPILRFENQSLTAVEKAYLLAVRIIRNTNVLWDGNVKFRAI